MTLVVRAIVRAADIARHGGFIAVPGGEMAALATHADAAPTPDEPALREHHALATRIHEAGPSLPSRFGQSFPDESALARAVVARHDELRTALEALGDRVEMSVTLAWREPVDDAPGPEPRTGREFLISRAALEREREEAAKAAARLVEGLANERAVSRQHICPRPGVAAIVAFLVERHEVRELRDRVYAFARNDRSVSVTVHGPMPPYTFAS